MRRLRAPILTFCLLAFAMGAAPSSQAATGLSAPVGMESIDWKWVVTQGGLTGLTIVILWSYRRDMLRLLDAAREEKAALMSALTAATVALTTHTEVSREQIEAQGELAKAVERCKLAQEWATSRK